MKRERGKERVLGEWEGASLGFLGLSDLKITHFQLQTTRGPIRAHQGLLVTD